MRLTLRTMLAYLDGVLDPADAETLGKKIKESKFATDLVERIQAVVRKSRLGVPRVDGKGMGLDPNTVADYLENLLPPDRVPDFEKVCLESDQHLAEVAACHQILTMVLGKPADINPASRERMYRVGTRILDGQARRTPAVAEAKPKTDAAAERAAAVQKASPAAPPHEHHAPQEARPAREQPAARDEKPAREDKPARDEKSHRDAAARKDEPAHRNERAARDDKPAREKPEVPDYLRESRRRRLWPLALTVLFAFLLAAVLLRAMGPFNGEHPLARLVIGKTPEVAKANPQPDGVKPETPAKPDDKQPAEETPGVKPPGEFVPGDNPEPGKLPGDMPEEEPPAKPATSVPGVDTGKPTEPPPKRPVDPDEPEFPDEPAKTPAKPEVPAKSPAKPEAPSPGSPAPADRPIPPNLVVGRFISDQQVLARFDERSGEWFRLRKESSLAAGDRLLVLPSYRPQISLVSGVQLTIAGESEIELLPPDEKGAAQLRVEYGKVSILTSGKPGAQIGLILGKRKGLASFENVDSALAVEVRNYRYPGDFPDKIAPHRVAELFATSGKINWAEADGENTNLTAGEIRIYLDDKPGDTEPLADQPDWSRGKGLKDIERTAAQTLADMLPVDRSLMLSLRERAESPTEKKVEVRSLAVRSLMYLDVFDPFVQALNDDKQKSFWYSEFDAAQDALARGPESADQLRKAFEALRTEDAASLYRLLIGYSPEELNRSGASSGASKLIEFLEHESLDMRVLASESLLRITGKTLSYRPEVAQPRRIQPINRWRQELKAGTLVYKTNPSPFVERKASAAKAPAPAKEPSPEPSGR